jgi:hypothetical protein
LYIDALTDLIPWFFALDHTNYARRVSVHVRDMSELQTKLPNIYAQFTHGKFTVHKSHHAFLGLAIDHTHDQLNAVVKGDGGIIGLTDNASAMARWIVCVSDVARLLEEFECSMDTVAGFVHVSETHHEQQPSTQDAFVNDVRKLLTTMLDMGNPFEELNDLVVLHNRNIVPAEIAELAGKLHDIGKTQYDEFVKPRLVTCEVFLFAPIKKKKFSLIVTQKPASLSKAKTKLAAARNDAASFCRLFIACQIHNSDLDEFFKHENQVFFHQKVQAASTISDAGSLHFACKSNLTSCLETVSPCVREMHSVDAQVLDGSAVVNMLKSGNAITFDDYASKGFMPYICSQLASVKRLDTVWDRYDPASLKAITRDKRGTGS